jgi:hypothetical protein
VSIVSLDDDVKTWTATANEPFINLSASGGVSPSNLGVSINTAGLTIEGSPYRGKVFIVINGQDRAEVNVNVQIVPDAAPAPVLNVVPNIISANVLEGEQMTPIAVQVTSLDGESYPFVSLVRTEGLEVIPAAGQTPGFITLSVDTTVLEASPVPYDFQMEVVAPDLFESPGSVALRVNVVDPDEAGQLRVVPRSLTMGAPEGSEDVVSEVIQVSTRGGLERPFVVLEPAEPWLSATASGLRTPGSIRVEADPTGLTANDSPLEGSVTLRAGEETVVIPVTLLIGEVPPVAEAGENATTAPTHFTLDAGASNSPLDRDITFAWSQIDGPEVDLSDVDTPNPSFLAVEAAEYTFEVTVTDTEGLSNADIVVVTVPDVSPTANAGVDLAFFLETESRQLQLFGARSADANGTQLQFLWEQVGGPEVTLSNPQEAEATFDVSAAGQYTFDLTVFDGAGNAGTDRVNYTVHAPDDTVPTAIVTAQDNLLVNLTASLDGSASSTGGDGDELTFAWRQVSGPLGILNDADASVASFEAQAPGVAVFELVVSDGTHDSAPAIVEVAVDERGNQVPTADSSLEAVTVTDLSEGLLLDATASSNGEEDPDGDLLSHFWSLGEGTETDVRPTEDTRIWTTNPHLTGAFEFSLRVSD